MTYNPKCLKNLVNIKPGQALPGCGRPKGSLNIRARIERALMAVVTKGKGKVSTEFDEILATGINRAKRGDLTWAKYITDTLVAAIERHEKQLTQAEQAQAVQLNQQINVSVQQQKYDLTRLTPDEINTWRELARKCAVDQGT